MGIFKNIGRNIPGGSYLSRNFPRGNLPGESLISGNFPGWNFPGGSFPDIEKNICEKFSSLHALTLIFIKRIFILQTHSLRV